MVNPEFLEALDMAVVEMVLDAESPAARSYAVVMRDRVQEVLVAVRDEKDLTTEADGYVKALGLMLALGNMPIPNAVEVFTKKLTKEMDEWHRQIRSAR